ncbi:FliA/WhiG family RNA polymerase sigma factor [Virgibacillus halodenitrificans]|uniref:FliA/WhiG family RNA polymerase sigma factor n=1 Tax=Virgibacillus halodenitrificans TaxID=1482 RepID=UPI0002F306B7|nr:FliA/WhiG family RNA polymerase sigma factor [Virgibacillus halodenitrificans]MEC2160323.1 FliA/WhiG family RNA polymerase sigma factor [Virgibacillus halodenitrificans]MYL45986.1 FliA/WhiG family RNA polymerase sigma factor [Virgibacillus halodenitrificans]
MTEHNLTHEQQLWNDWYKRKSNESANELIQHYTYLISFHVERISSHLPSNVSKDDIKSFATFGLYDALNKFEPDRDLKFDTYASFRIRGSIMDGLRKEDWLPRSLREKTKKIEQVAQELEQSLYRKPTTEEIANKIGFTVKEVENVLRDSLFSNFLSMDENPKDMENDKDRNGYSLPDDTTITPENSLLFKELKEELANGMKTLNENEQMVISLFYNDELTLTEIGQVLGLTTSRISQIHKRSILKLRSTLKKLHEIS